MRFAIKTSPQDTTWDAMRQRPPAYPAHAARFAQHWNCDDRTIEEVGQARDALHQHCAEIGRDPVQIRLSAQARFGGDPASTSATAAAYAQAGAQLLIISLPPPHTPAVLEPLATALRELC